MVRVLRRRERFPQIATLDYFLKIRRLKPFRALGYRPPALIGKLPFPRELCLEYRVLDGWQVAFVCETKGASVLGRILLILSRVRDLLMF